MHHSEQKALYNGCIAFRSGRWQTSSAVHNQVEKVKKKKNTWLAFAPFTARALLHQEMCKQEKGASSAAPFISALLFMSHGQIHT